MEFSAKVPAPHRVANGCENSSTQTTGRATDDKAKTKQVATSTGLGRKLRSLFSADLGTVINDSHDAVDEAHGRRVVLDLIWVVLVFVIQ